MTEAFALDAPTLTPDEQWRRWIERYSWHLDLVPGLLEFMRDEVPRISSDSRRYGAERVSSSRDGAPLPFSAEVLDGADELWAALVQYAENVDDLLQRHAPLILAPLPVVSRWRARGEAQGIRLGADVRRDSFAIVAWLVERVQWIAPLEQLEDSESFLFAMIRQLRNRYLGGTPRRRTREPDICRLCLTGEVVVTFVDEPLSTEGKRVAKCTLCGQVYT
ncbi:MAG: hypothetical protein K0S70_827 [Microbacterium sp.]|jgi:hypothetical protein|nr:hypothetical protein [Microbacterium sp.]